MLTRLRADPELAFSGNRLGLTADVADWSAFRLTAFSEEAVVTYAVVRVST